MEKFVTSDGLSLAFHDRGVGPAVLCLAGLTRNSRDFEPLVPHMDGVRLIRLDYRGRGASDHDPNPLNYSVPREAQDVLELMDHLGLEQAALIGTSRGGIIAMLLATLAKYRLSGVMLNDIGPELAPQGLEFILGYIGKPPPYRTYAEAASKLALANPGFPNLDTSHWLAEAKRRWIETPQGLQITYDPKLADAVIAASRQPAVDLWPLFEALDGLPLALTRGENSDLLSRETVMKMQERRPDMIYAQIADRGHVPYLDEPQSIEVINRFLGSLP